ncbi:MAG: BON domain-containing protein [Gemmataceae bacterium]|jgi:osmotically-inducible protein OsmY|nr:BON domain-containing protein [Gemmataceae bacterium]
MKRFFPLLCLLVTLWGCGKDDPEKLRAISQAGYQDVRRVIPEKIPVEQLVPEKGPESTPVQHVRSRLSNDKYLRRFSIEVSAIENGVKLTGRVPTKEHARRATELAESTVGVEIVTNEIVVD